MSSYGKLRELVRYDDFDGYEKLAEAIFPDEHERKYFNCKIDFLKKFDFLEETHLFERSLRWQCESEEERKLREI